MSIDVVCMGEILVDVIPTEPGVYRDGLRFEIHFGGAPANVAVGVARLNHRSAFIGAVGNDSFGDMLRNFLEHEGVDTRWLVRKEARTSLAFVIHHKSGERDFFFYREPWVKTADTMLDVSDINLDEILKAKVVHVSGVATAYPPLSESVYTVMKRAFDAGLHVSIDPNYRWDIWGGGGRALERMDRYIRTSTMISIGLDEIESIFGSRDYRHTAIKIMERYPNIGIVAVRLGAMGSYVVTKEEELYMPAYRIEPIDTTGAGDAWTATFIVNHILERRDLRTSMSYANAAGALKCLKRGAVTAFPRRSELEEFIKSRGTSTK
ncbi:MAG: carbohydrate kinase [Ignisphaera sp.]|nr:carbohydrate kinase [Ignisphaera sp.]MCX8167711.1 carbohydrate kinase [Ignisphaera sp.]MDW8085275.1 carbohydrate kinase [Ignisphaera sp.]